LLSFAFEKAGKERLEFRFDDENTRIPAALKGIRCKVNGALRRNMLNTMGDVAIQSYAVF
jgi:hypothetical protein